MNNTKTSIVDMISGEQLVDTIKTLTLGTVVLLLAYGAYYSGYSLQLSIEGVELSLCPNKAVDAKC
ncbi:MAG: hypothetical protein GX625_12760 [Clostridiaceae bacterium]|nr:hypothetical protein [Clostridiaceae bacterium]